MSRDLGDMVARVLEENPLPEQLGELPAVTRRQLDVAADREGVPVAAYYASLRAQIATDAAAASVAADALAEIMAARHGF